MVNSVWSIITGAITLALFGAVVWAYLIWGRIYVGLSGNLELVVVGIALWEVRGAISGAGQSFTSAIRNAMAR